MYISGITALATTLVVCYSQEVEQCLSGTSEVAFHEWIDKRDGKVNGVEVGYFEGFGRGIVAKQDLREKQTVMKIPSATVISQESMVELGGGAKVLADALGSTRPEMMIASFLVMEKIKSQESDWKAYLDVLPEKVNAAWLFSEQAFQALGDDLMVDELTFIRSRVQTDFKEKIQSLIKEALHADGVMDIPLEEIKEADLLWGLSIVESRALTVKGVKYLAPMVDMFNYKFHPVPRANQRGNFFLEHHVFEEKELTILADRDTKAGEQLFMDYGDNANHIYLRFHGFIPDENPFDCAYITKELPSEQDADYFAPREELRKALGLPQIAKDCFRWDSVEGFWPGSFVNAFGRLAKLPNDKVEECLKEIEAVEQYQKVETARSCIREIPLGTDVLVELIKKELDRLQAFPDAAEDAADDVKLAVRYRKSQMKELTNMKDYLAELKRPPSLYGIPFVPEADQIILALGRDSEEARNAALQADVAVKAENLNAWVAAQNFPVVKIKAVSIPGLRLGTIATEDVGSEEPYLVVPRDAVMDQNTVRKSLVYPYLYHLVFDLKSPDPFHELLVFLMFEYFVQGTRSEWWPYLASLPLPSEMGAPSFFNEDELQTLEGHPVKEEIVANAEAVRRKFVAVRSFLYDALGEVFLPSDLFTEENYFWAHAILDSRAIWWNKERHLVPLLDMVNCKTSKDRVHNTKFSADIGGAITKTAEEYKAGEQIFENYGQPNHIYFMFHGFSLDDNDAHNCMTVKFMVPTIGMRTFCVSKPLSENRDIIMVAGSIDPALDALKEIQANFPTTLEEDKKELESLPPGNLRNAKQFLVHEKEFLNELLRSV